MQKTKTALILPLVLLLSTPHMSHANWFNNLYNSFVHGEQSSTQPITFNEREAHNYIDQTIASLERALRSHMPHTELSDLKRAVHSSVTNAKYAYQNSNSFISAGRKYKKDVIDQFLASAVLEYIEKTSYAYTYKRTQDRSIATRVSNSMRNNALAIIAQNSVINFERLTPFVGYALERAVNDMIAHSHHTHDDDYDTDIIKPTAHTHHKPHTVTVPKEQTFESKECVACFENLNKLNRVILKPCGHDICKKCAFEWFCGASQKTTCPTCRASVNMTKLQDDII